VVIVEIRTKVKRRLKLGNANRLILQDATLQNENYGDQKLDRFGAINCNFEHCRFDNIEIKDACFGEGKKMSNYTDCSFDGVTIKRFAPGGSRFERCSFKNVDIRDLLSLSSEFVDCTFSGKLTKCVFDASTLERI
jgi:uncharacterized protein YjbI with pentapeptide repeats